MAAHPARRPADRLTRRQPATKRMQLDEFLDIGASKVRRTSGRSWLVVLIVEDVTRRLMT